MCTVCVFWERVANFMCTVFEFVIITNTCVNIIMLSADITRDADRWVSRLHARFVPNDGCSVCCGSQRSLLWERSQLCSCNSGHTERHTNWRPDVMQHSAQLVNSFPVFYATWKLTTVITESCTLVQVHGRTRLRDAISHTPDALRTWRLTTC
jgi:hypothetical protein